MMVDWFKKEKEERREEERRQERRCEEDNNNNKTPTKQEDFSLPNEQLRASFKGATPPFLGWLLQRITGCS